MARASVLFFGCKAPNLGHIQPRPGWWICTIQRPSMWRSQEHDHRLYRTDNARCASAGDGYAAAIIKSKRSEFRVNSKFSNCILDLRVEQYKLIYDALMAMGGIYPKNLAMKEPPKRHAETDAYLPRWWTSWWIWAYGPGRSGRKSRSFALKDLVMRAEMEAVVRASGLGHGLCLALLDPSNARNARIQVLAETTRKATHES